MNCKIVVSSVFERSAKKLAKRYSFFRNDFADFVSGLKDNPFVGTDLGHGLRKISTLSDNDLKHLLKRCGIE